MKKNLRRYLRLIRKDGVSAFRHLRRWLIAWGGVAVLGLTVLLAGVAWLAPLDPVVIKSLCTLKSSFAWMEAARYASYLGDFLGFNLLVFAALQVSGWCLRSPRLLRLATASVLCATLAGLTANVVRVATGRPRPFVKVQDGLYGPTWNKSMHSLPSAHTATAMGGALPVMLLLAACDRFPSRLHGWTWAVLALWTCLCLGLAGICQTWDWPPGLNRILSTGTWLFTGLTLMGIVVSMGAIWPTVSRAVLPVVLVLTGLSAAALSTSIRDINAAAQLADNAPALSAGTDFVACKFTEPSLVFHFDRMWRYTSKLTSFQERLAKKGPRYAIVQRREWTLSDCFQRAWQGRPMAAPSNDASAEVDTLLKTFPDYQSSTTSVFNAARSSWIELVVMKRL